MARAFWTRGALTGRTRFGLSGATSWNRCPRFAGRGPISGPKDVVFSSYPETRASPLGRQPCSGSRDHNVVILPSRPNASVGRESGRVAQLVRAFRLHRRGRGFESLSAHSVAICPGWSLHPELNSVDECKGATVPDCQFKDFRSEHACRLHRSLPLPGSRHGKDHRVLRFSRPTRSRRGSPVAAHRIRLSAIDTLGFGMDSRRFVRGGWRAGTHDHCFA